MKKIDHIGIAVKSLDQVLPFYTDTLKISCVAIEEVESENVRVAIIDVSNVKIELIEPTDEKSAVAKFIQKYGEGIHHIAFSVSSIEDRIATLKRDGVRIIQDKPILGAMGAQVAFIHPLSAHGVLYEVCESTTGGNYKW